ncbi:MAG: RNA polymerase sigma factor [Acidobacteriota bacterium]
MATKLFNPSATAAPDAAISAEAMDRLRPRLERVLRKICPPWLKSQSDDLVQVAMLRLVDVLAASEQERTFNSSYLYKVAYSALVDEIRRLRRRREVAIEDDEGEPMPIEARVPDPEARTAGSQLRDEIAECLKRLIAPRRAAVVLHLHGHSAAEAADLGGWGLKQARNLIQRGRADLRACLAGKGLQP